MAGSRVAPRGDSDRNAAENQCHTVRFGHGRCMSPEVRRALCPTEKCYWIADQISPTNIVARVHLRGHIAAGLLDRAAAALAAEHPLLRVSIRIDADGTNPTFVPSAGAVPVRRVNGDDLEWERQVDDHEVGTPLDWRRGPLIRIVDVALGFSDDEAHDLLLTVSHIIADGTDRAFAAAQAGRARRSPFCGGLPRRCREVAARRCFARRAPARSLSRRAGHGHVRGVRIGRSAGDDNGSAAPARTGVNRGHGT